MPLKPPPIDGAWRCEYCGRENWSDRLQCEGCGASRPRPARPARVSLNYRVNYCAGPLLDDPAAMFWIQK